MLCVHSTITHGVCGRFPSPSTLRAGSSSAFARGTRPTILSPPLFGPRGSKSASCYVSTAGCSHTDPYRSWDLHVTSSSHRVKLYSVNKSKPLTAQRLAQLEAHGQPIEPLTKPVEFALESTEEYLAFARKHPREPKD
jgi:hypothetical protein